VAGVLVLSDADIVDEFVMVFLNEMFSFTGDCYMSEEWPKED
jgi:hypothetical protein